jgi:hypothetical protein
MTYSEKLVTGVLPAHAAGRWLKVCHFTTEAAPITADIGRPVLGMLPRRELAPLGSDTADSVRFQPLSPDDGKTWETNWITEMTRIAEEP